MGTAATPLPWTDDPCAGLDVADDPYAAQIATWTAQDDLAPPPSGGLVVLGSSTIRRWRSAQRALSAWQPIQRGFGGGLATDVAAHLPELALRHHPTAVLMYAGSNDLAAGRSPASVVDAWRCVAQQLHDAAPGAALFFAGINPTPARWSLWASAQQVNRAIRALAAQHPSLTYIDTAPALLATGSPPDRALFVDGQHLSEEGYALWGAVLVEALTADLPPQAPAPRSSLAVGTRIRVDLGPSNAEDGAPAPETDGSGAHWNAWHAVDGGAQILAGEALRGLRSTTGQATGVDLIISGGFRARGLRDGGLTRPSAERLGALAVPEATEDYVYTGGPDDPGGLALRGLDPAARYTLRLFASQADEAQARITRFVVHGAGDPVLAEVQSTGAELGAAGDDGDDGALVVLRDLAPDAYGALFIDVDRVKGDFAYLNLFELEVTVSDR